MWNKLLGFGASFVAALAAVIGLLRLKEKADAEAEKRVRMEQQMKAEKRAKEAANEADEVIERSNRDDASGSDSGKRNWFSRGYRFRKGKED